MKLTNEMRIPLLFELKTDEHLKRSQERNDISSKTRANRDYNPRHLEVRNQKE